MMEMENLQNKGWEQMNALLDREMPVRKPRRRFFWLPLLFGAIAVGAAVGLYFQPWKATSAEPTDPEKVEVLSVEDMASGTSPAQSATVNESTTDQPTGQTQKSSIGANIEPNTLTSTIPAKTAEENASSDAPAIFTEQNEEVIAQDAPVDEQIQSDRPDVLSTQSVASETLGSEPVLVTTEVQSERSLLTVPSITSADIDWANETTQVAVPVVAPAKQGFTSQWGMDVYAATHVLTPTTAMRGIELGLLSNVTVGRRVKLNFGLGYGHYDNEGLIELGGFSDDEAFVLDPGSGASQDTMRPVERINLQNVDYDTALLISQRFDYLHMPVFVEYRLNNWLNVVGGLRVSYLLSAPPASTSERILYPNTFNIVADNQVAKSALLDESIVRRWDFAPLIGLSADIGRRLAIDVQYQMGLVPYIDRPAMDRQDFNRSLSLGLRVKLL